MGMFWYRSLTVRLKLVIDEALFDSRIAARESATMQATDQFQRARARKHNCESRKELWIIDQRRRHFSLRSS